MHIIPWSSKESDLTLSVFHSRKLVPELLGTATLPLGPSLFDDKGQAVVVPLQRAAQHADNVIEGVTIGLSDVACSIERGVTGIRDRMEVSHAPAVSCQRAAERWRAEVGERHVGGLRGPANDLL